MKRRENEKDDSCDTASKKGGPAQNDRREDAKNMIVQEITIQQASKTNSSNAVIKLRAMSGD